MHVIVLILRVSTLLHRFISFCRLAFRQRRPGLFPDRRPCAYPPSYLGLGLMGILPSFLPRSFGTVHAQPFCPHSPFVSLVFGHILSNGRAAFFWQYRYRFRPCDFHNESGGWNRRFVLGPLHSHQNGLSFLAGGLLASFIITCD